MNAMLGLA